FCRRIYLCGPVRYHAGLTREGHSRPALTDHMDVGRTLDFSPIASELHLSVDQVARVAQLLDAGNTVPFITRYRKEQTGNLDEEQIRAIQHRVDSARQLAERAATVLRLIEVQGKLTPKLEK